MSSLASLAAHIAPPDLASRQVAARRIIAWTVVGGVGGDVLLRVAGVGVNVALWLLLLVAAVVSLSRRRHGGLLDRQREPLVAAIGFALLLAVRDSEMLAAWNIAASLGAVAFAALMSSPEPLAPLGRLPLGAAIGRLVRIGPEALLGAFPFLGNEAPLVVAGHHRHLFAARLIAQAVVVSLAVAGVLFALLRAGDAVFARATDALVTWDPGSLMLHLFCSALFAWPVMGWLHRWSTFHANETASTRRFSAPSLDASAILMAMNVVFAAFLAVQVRVLFGGQAYVQSVTGLTIAEYARSGFFALMWATAFVLVVLLALDATATRGSLAAVPRHRRMSATLVGMVALLLGSALVRMKLYIDAFGLSTDRLYAVVAMLWVTVALVGFAWTVLRGKRDAFTAVAVRSGWAILLALNLANPVALVTRVNLDRARAGGSFDYRYHVDLGADAAPILTRAFASSFVAPPAVWSVAPQAPSFELCNAVEGLIASYGRASQRPIRAWNVADSRARSAVAAHHEALRLRCPVRLPSR